ncbi:hypothetical protein LZ31DRAFT_130031 [Colletotrichum somersetense]|nr:hypothetical protein LZ31DRAFT_130031 [Colletotrichum somersetense]
MTLKSRDSGTIGFGPKRAAELKAGKKRMEYVCYCRGAEDPAQQRDLPKLTLIQSHLIGATLGLASGVVDSPPRSGLLSGRLEPIFPALPRWREGLLDTPCLWRDRKVGYQWLPRDDSTVCHQVRHTRCPGLVWGLAKRDKQGSLQWKAFANASCTSTALPPISDNWGLGRPNKDTDNKEAFPHVR